LIQRLTGDGFEQTILETLFMRLGPESYTPAYTALKITELYGVPGIGINREKAPSPVFPEGYSPPARWILWEIIRICCSSAATIPKPEPG